MRPDRYGMAGWLAAAMIALALLLPAVPAMAAEGGGRRLALLIGNDDYLAQPKLQKAGGDVAALEAAFQKLGFAVTLARDLDYGAMALAIADFEATIQPGDTVVFHFAGHGVSIRGRNYLLPTDFPAATGRTAESLIPRRAFDAGEVIDGLRAQGARLTFAVLDACRDNPIGAAPGRSVGLSRGLSRMDAPQGVFILFSAGPGETALDRLGDGDASPVSVFTRAFLPNLEVPGLTLVAIAKKTQADVRRLAASVGGTQFPDYSDRVEGDVVLAPAAAPPPSDALQADLTFWNGIRGDDPALFAAYLDRFGDKGMFAPIARQRLAALASRREADERRAAEERRRAEEARLRDEKRAEEERRRTEQRAAEEARRLEEQRRAGQQQVGQQQVGQQRTGQQQTGPQQTGQQQAEQTGRTAALLQAGPPAAPVTAPPSKDPSDPATERAWFDAQADGSTAALQGFAEKFPDHALAREARALIEARADAAAFRTASQLGTREAMQAYLRERPRGRHREAAAAFVAAAGLSAWVDRDYAADRQNDDTEFAVAEAAGTREAFAAYLKARPKGRHREAATKQVARLATQSWLGLSTPAPPTAAIAAPQAATPAADPAATKIIASTPPPTLPEIAPGPAWLGTSPLDGLRPVDAARQRLYGIAFSPQGGRLFVGTADGRVAGFDLASGTQTFSAARQSGKVYTSEIFAVAMAPDGRSLAALGQTDVRILDTASGRLLRSLDKPGSELETAAYSPDGRLLATAGPDRTLKLWNAADGKLLRSLQPRSNVRAVTFSPDGRLLASASDDKTVKIWDPANGKLLRTFSGHTNTLWTVAFSPDGRVLASGSADDTIRLWDPATGASLGVLPAAARVVESVAFSPDGRLLASAGWEGTVRLWDTATRLPLKTFGRHSDWIESVAFSPDGKLLASSAHDGTVRLWRVADGAAAGILMPLKGGAAAAIGADGRYVATAGAEAMLSVLAGGATHAIDEAYRTRWRRTGSAALTAVP